MSEALQRLLQEIDQIDGGRKNRRMFSTLKSTTSKDLEEPTENIINFQQMQRARILRFYIEALVYDIKENYGKQILDDIIIDITAGYGTQNLTKVKFIHSFLYHVMEKWYRRNPLTIQQALKDIVNNFLYTGITKNDCQQINVRRTVSKICKMIRFENANKIENQRLFRRVYDMMKADSTYFYPWIQYLKRNDKITIIDD